MQVVEPQVTNEASNRSLDGTPAWAMFGNCYVRREVLLDSRYLDWVFTQWLPIFCPSCVARRVMHAFEYFVRNVDGSYEAWCEVCGKYLNFHKGGTS